MDALNDLLHGVGKADGSFATRVVRRLHDPSTESIRLGPFDPHVEDEQGRTLRFV